MMERCFILKFSSRQLVVVSLTVVAHKQVPPQLNLRLLFIRFARAAVRNDHSAEVFAENAIDLPLEERYRIKL